MRHIARKLTVLFLLLTFLLCCGCGKKAVIAENGVYTVIASLKGGSGKTTLLNPTLLTVENGEMTAELVFSSRSYDYVLVNGERFEVLSTEPGSTFRIPVEALDKELPLIGDTVAMSTPHEIEYTLLLDSSTLETVK
ncbi:MAG: hypothetical protein MJ074_04480 [Oscillospiraceae bacterium]|nr:hypothetical protein [Oscillospiraceae bacterium]